MVTVFTVSGAGLSIATRRFIRPNLVFQKGLASFTHGRLDTDSLLGRQLEDSLGEQSEERSALLPAECSRTGRTGTGELLILGGVR